jgi:hypothetical protein
MLRRLVIAALLAGSAIAPLGAHADKPAIDASYANDTVVYMIGSHLDTAPSANLLAKAPPLYLMVYPVAPDAGAITTASGYQPQCDPCFHPGVPLAFAHHDHVLTGAPGFGRNGTAGDYEGPWRITIALYNPNVLTDPGFQPIRDDEAIPAAVASGEIQAVIPTGLVLICPLVSPHA